MRVFTFYKTDGFFWFRIFGYGLVIKNIKKHHLLFTERMGIQKTFKFGNWIVRFLDKNVN